MAAWDVIVIGGGAAGLTAAAAAAEAGRRCLVVDRMGGGGELMNLGPLLDVEPATTGPDLAAQLLDAAVTAGAELAIGEVTVLAPQTGGWRVVVDDDTHTAAAVILAIGLAPGQLGVANEDDFVGQGLSHCAACDGPLCRGEAVAVAGNDRWAQHEAAELVGFAAGSVTLIGDGSAPDGVTGLAGRIIALEGEGGLQTVRVQPDEDGAPIRLPLHMLFVQTGRRPALGFAPADLARDAAGQVLTDAACRSNLPGLSAIGDARAGAARTLASAMADARQAVASLAPLGNAAD